MPEPWMDVDVALAEVPINKAQLIDDTDFKTREESVVYNQSGLDLIWIFTTTAGVTTYTAVTPTDTGGVYDFINQGNGFYTIEIPASGGGTINNDTEGFGYFAGFATGILPWIGPTIGFRSSALNNSLIDGPVGVTPATQDQVGAIGTVGGAALNFPVEDDNVDGALNGVTFVGVQTSGTFVSIEAAQGTYHIIDDDTNNIDIVYQFNLGGNRTATEFIWKGYLAGIGDSVNIQAYDFVGSDWETREVITGKNQSVNETLPVPLLAKHTGTGSNVGIVYCRLVVASATNPTLNTDELILEAVATGAVTGFANGAVWVDTNDGVVGTAAGIGHADNPSSNLTDALTIGAANKLKKFSIAPNSTITLGASFTNKEMEGHEWTLDLSGEDIGGSEFVGATVSGIGTGSGTTEFLDCFMGATTIPAGTHLINCDWEGDITLGAAGTFFFENCTHGSSSPSVLDYGSGLDASTVHMHPFRGALEIKNMGAGSGTYLLHIDGDGTLTINGNSSATSTINISGSRTITNNASNITINDDARIDVAQVLAQVNTGFTTQMADSVPSNSTRLTREQGLYMLSQRQLDFAIVGTTLTVFKVDGTTALYTLTLNDATDPSAAARAT